LLPPITKLWKTFHPASEASIEEFEQRFQTRDKKVWRSAPSVLTLADGQKINTYSAAKFIAEGNRTYFIRATVESKADGISKKGLLFLIYMSKQLTQGHTYGVVIFEDGSEKMMLLDGPCSLLQPTDPLELADPETFLQYSQETVIPQTPRWIQASHPSPKGRPKANFPARSSKRARKTPDRVLAEIPARLPRVKRSTSKPQSPEVSLRLRQAEANILNAIKEKSKEPKSKEPIFERPNRALDLFREDREKERNFIERLVTLQQQGHNETPRQSTPAPSENILDFKMSVRQILELRCAFNSAEIKP